MIRYSTSFWDHWFQTMIRNYLSNRFYITCNTINKIILRYSKIVNYRRASWGNRSKCVITLYSTIYAIIIRDSWSKSIKASPCMLQILSTRSRSGTSSIKDIASSLLPIRLLRSPNKNKNQHNWYAEIIHTVYSVWRPFTKVLKKDRRRKGPPKGVSMHNSQNKQV